MDKTTGVGIAVALIAPASEGIRRYLEERGMIPLLHPAWLIANIIIFCAGLGLLIWSLCFKKKEKIPTTSIKPPIRLIPKRKVRRIIHRTETINGKTKYTEEIEIEP